MSVTRSSPPDLLGAAREAAPAEAPAVEPSPPVVAVGQRRRLINRGALVDITLGIFTLVMLATMIAVPGEDALPYHLMFLSITLVYGFRVWPMWPTLLAVSVIAVSTGAVMYAHYLDHKIDAPELFEVPLMPMLLLAMMWHARRRAAAQQQVEEMAEERRRNLEREREFLRDTSHAIRTPVTIARGHVELIQAGLDDATAYGDSEVVLRQLDRMCALSSRLLALARLDSMQALPLQPLDLDDLVGEMGANWTGSADRDWAVVRGGGRVLADREWLELAVDAIVENAVHFTTPGERIELACWHGKDGDTIAVSDSGPGIAPDDLPHVFERFWHRRPPEVMPGSGLGLAMAWSAANAMGGTLQVTSRPGQGTRFELTLPHAR
jgi:signal transduction histidine kinase